jgi:hypothetical protein
MSDKLERLEELAPLAPRALATKKLGQSLGQAEGAAREALQECERLTALVDIVVATDGVANASLKPVIEDALDRFDDVGGLLATAADAESLRGIERDYKDLKDSLSRLSMAVRNHWTNVANREFHPFQTIGEVLIKVDKTRALGERMQSVAEKAAEAARQSSAQAMRRAIIAAIDLRAQVNTERKILFGDPEVDAFLEAAASGTASLEQVTPGVLMKLKELDALAAFKVSG